MRAFVLGIMVTLGSPAGADEVSDRTGVIARIDEAVHAISTALDAHKLPDATVHGRELRELITRLGTLKGNDDRAADIVARYPRYADAVDGAINHVATLEQKVHRTDGLAARCAKDDADLHALIKRRTSHPDPEPTRDIDALGTKADAYAAIWGPVLRDLATVDHAILDDIAASKLALTDGYWMAVSTSLGNEVKSVVDGWTEQYEAVTTACEPLHLGQHHADLAPVLEALRARVTTDRSSAAQLVHDYDALLASVRNLRALALQGRKSLRDAVCQAIDGEVASRVGTVASTWGQDLDERTSLANAEISRLQMLHAPKPIAEGLRTIRAMIANIARDESRGRSNPRLVTTLAAIAKRRDHGVAGAKCVVKDLDCGTACRASCVVLANHVCTIVEPVPDQEGAKAAGFARAQRELDAVSAWYSRDKASLFARVPALKGCEVTARHTLDLSTDVVSYATCSAVTEAELGEPLAEVPADL